MSQPQPELNRPAAQPPPGDQPTRVEQGKPETAAAEPDNVPEQRTASTYPDLGSAQPARDDVPAETRNLAEADRPGGEPATRIDRDTPDPDGRDTPDQEEPATDKLAARWSGSAAVPPPAPKKRRWLETRIEPAQASPPPPRRDPTLEFPTAEREALESSVPVDPWAGAGADPWGAHGEGLTPPARYPPTRPYEAPPAPPPAHPPLSPGPRRPPAAGPPALPGPPVRKPVRSAKRGRPAPPAPYRPQPPPPGWQAPPGYVPVAVRRRRRWPWFLLATFLCCCGIPGYLTQPMWTQYPASVNLPAEVAELRLRDDPVSERTADRLKLAVRGDHLLAEETFAAVYGTAGGKQVIIFGTTGFRFSPESDVKAEMTRLTEKYQLSDVRPVRTDTRGAYQRCGTGRAEGTDVVVCTWADHGSLTTALFTRLSIPDSAALLAQLQRSILTRS